METKLTGEPVSNFWLWIRLKHATYAIHVEDNKITEAPPIARWCIGRTAHKVIEKIMCSEGAIAIRMKEYVE